MHPLLSRPVYAIFYFVAWLLPIAAATMNWSADWNAWPATLALTLPMGACLALLCLAMHYVTQVQPLHLANWPRVSALHAASALLSSALWAQASLTWAAWLVNSPWRSPLAVALPLARLPLVAGGALCLLLSSALFLAITALTARQAAEVRAKELTALAREAELIALRAQIHPHFLFNSLNSINALIGQRPDEARRLCVTLGDYLRLSLTLGARARVSLREELALAERLLSIEQARFGERLRYSIQADPACLDTLVPPLILQALVENAVTHGIAQLIEGGEIALRAERGPCGLLLDLRNPRDPEAAAKRGTGTGLKNTRERLTAAYGARAQFAVERGATHFRVTLTLPVTETA
ncbi:MAG: histidine kinase [Vicinamibacteria bacterium]|nr:histidine kinase [Vicinamibacteria bacterium]